MLDSSEEHKMNMVEVQIEHSIEVRLSPMLESKEEVDVVWQIPPSPRAVLFLAHRGTGKPTTFWEPHPGCPACSGTPDHVAIVKYALNRGFAVIAIKSVKSFWQDWPPDFSHDAHNVTSILKSWISQHGLQAAPLVGLGVASGGNFLSMLALKMKFSALVLMISAGLVKAFEQAEHSNYPPTLFVHMPKDQVTASRVLQHVVSLKQKGVSVAEVACLEFPITHFYFANHIRSFGLDASSKLYTVLLSQGIIDSNGIVASSPRVHELDNLLHKFDVVPLQQEDDCYTITLKEHISSLLRVAEARHAVTGRKCPEIFDWLERRLWGPQDDSGTLENEEQQIVPFSIALQ